MLYLLHAGALLAGCFLYYWLLLRNETHFTLNRWVLLGCLAGSLLLPLVTVPAGLSLRQALQAEAGDAEVAAIVANETTGATNVSSSLPPAGTIGVTATPAPDKQSIKEIAQTSAEASTPSSLSPSTLHSRNSSTPQPSPLLPANLPRLLWWIYLAGVTVFGVHFLLQLGFLVVKLLRHPGFDAGGFHLVELDEEAAPYSFWNRVFLNPNRYDPETFHQIVQHEAVHVRQRHSMDLMLAELLVVFQWFNPFAWLYRKAIENNLEFLTDAEVLRQGEDPVDYQLSLVKVAAPNYPLGLTTSYNQNLLEKRITMMKTKKSSLASGWKYLSILPLLLLSMLQFNAVAQAPAPPAAPVPAVQPTVVPAPAPVAAPSPAPGVVASPAYTPVPTPSFDNAVPVPAPNPMPNPMPMPMAVVPDVDLSNMEIPMPAPTVEPVLEVSDQDFAKARRSWTAEIEGNEVCFMFIVADDNRQHLSTNSRCFPLAEFGTLPRGQMGKFSLKRTSGTLDMNGVFDGNEGLGSFTFTPDPSFVQTLASEGYEYENLELLHFFFIDFTPGYLRYLRQQGYDPTERQLFKLAIFGFSEEDFKETQQEYRTAGYDKPGLKNMIELRIHGVDGDYIKELTSAGYDDLSLNDVKKARIHGLSAAFVNDMAQAGFRDLDFDDVIKMAIHGVSSEYVQELADLGYTGLRADEVVNARIHGVSTEGLASLKKAGFTDLSLKEARNARIHGVDAEYVNELADLGYENLDLDEVIKAKIHGVSKRKVGDLKKAGLSDLTLKQARDAAIHGINAEYVQELADLGYQPLTIDEVVKAKIHGVSARKIGDLKKAGLSDLTLKEARDATIHGVDGEYVRELADLGFELANIKEVINAKIHGVNSRSIGDLKKAGLADISLKDARNAAIHGVNADQVEAFRKMGYTDMDFDDFVKARIHGVSPSFVKSYEDVGFGKISFRDLVKLRIHGVSANFLKKHKREGDDIGDLIDYKIRRGGRE